MVVPSTYIVFLSVLLLASGHVNDVYETNQSGEHSIELTQLINLARQEHIQEACNHLHRDFNYEQLSPDKLEHILVDEKHKLLYCYVPKVACTNWKRVFMILNGKWNNTDVLSIPANLAHKQGLIRSLSMMAKDERDFMLENYHKLIIVRNPFERLLSAFRNKLEGDTPSAKYFQNRVGRRIIKAFRPNPSNESLELGHDVTFKEFALFLTNQSEELADVVHNEHWQPITDLCHPCIIKYTLIGKYETLLDDSLLALHTIKAPDIQFPRLSRTSGTSEKLHKYYSQLDLPLIRRLYKLYKPDYKIFDYDLGNIVGFDLG